MLGSLSVSWSLHRYTLVGFVLLLLYTATATDCLSIFTGTRGVGVWMMWLGVAGHGLVSPHPVSYTTCRGGVWV
jgi:hypothetical protein